MTGGAGYIGSHAVKALVEAGQPTSSSTTTCRPGTGSGAPGGRRERSLVEGDIARHGAPRADDRRAPGRRGHALRRLAVGRRVGAQPGRLLPQQRHRRAVGARGDDRRRREALRVLVDRGGVRQSRSRRRSPKTTRSSRSTPTARPSWPSSGRCRTTSAPTASGRSRCATSTPPAPIPDGELGEHHDPELHVIPRAIDAALGRGTFQVFGEDYDTPDGTCLRDYVHVTDLAAAHLARARGAARRRARPPSTTSATAGRPRFARSSSRSSA